MNLYEKEKKELDTTSARLLDYISVPVEACKVKRKELTESVWVVAESNDLVLFYEDVEEGFEIGRRNKEGIIIYDYSNQWTLGMALNNLNLQIANPEVINSAQPD